MLFTPGVVGVDRLVVERRGVAHRHLDAAAGEFADQRRAARQFGREGPAGDQVAAFGEDGVIVLRRGILDVARVLSAFHLHREVAAFDVDAAERRAARVPFRGLAVGVEQAEKRRVGARGGGGVDQRRSVPCVHLGGAEHRLDRAVRKVVASSAVAVHVDEAGGGVAACRVDDFGAFEGLPEIGPDRCDAAVFDQDRRVFHDFGGHHHRGVDDLHPVGAFGGRGKAARQQSENGNQGFHAIAVFLRRYSEYARRTGTRQAGIRGRADRRR